MVGVLKEEETHRNRHTRKEDPSVKMEAEIRVMLIHTGDGS